MFAAKMPPTRLSLATIRPLRYELAGRGLLRGVRSHSCRPATFSRPTCLAPSRLFASVPPCSVSKSVANPLGDKYSRLTVTAIPPSFVHKSVHVPGRVGMLSRPPCSSHSIWRARADLAAACCSATRAVSETPVVP